MLKRSICQHPNSKRYSLLNMPLFCLSFLAPLKSRTEPSRRKAGHESRDKARHSKQFARNFISFPTSESLFNFFASLTTRTFPSTFLVSLGSLPRFPTNKFYYDVKGRKSISRVRRRFASKSIDLKTAFFPLLLSYPRGAFALPFWSAAVNTWAPNKWFKKNRNNLYSCIFETRHPSPNFFGRKIHRSILPSFYILHFFNHSSQLLLQPFIISLAISFDQF